MGEWFPDRIFDEDEWHKIILFSEEDEQFGLLGMRVEDNDGGIAIAMIYPDQAKAIAEHLTSWAKYIEESPKGHVE